MSPYEKCQIENVVKDLSNCYCTLPNKKYYLYNRNFICDNKSKISFYMYAYFYMYVCICIYIAIFMMLAIIFMNILHKNIPTVIISS